MAAGFVRQSTGNSSTAQTTGVVTLGATPVLGNLLVACIAFGSSTVGAQVSSISETSVVWLRAAQSAQNSTGTNRQEIWIGVVSAGASTTVNINFSAAAKWSANISEWTGLSTRLSAAAQSQSGVTSGSISTTFSPTLAAVGAGDLCVGVMNLATSNSSANFTASAGVPIAANALTWIGSGATTAQNVGMQALYLIATNAIAEGFSWSTSAAWQYALAVVGVQASDPFPLCHVTPVELAQANAVYRM